MKALIPRPEISTDIRRCQLLLVAAGSLLFSAAAAAQWQVINKPDAATGVNTPVAQVRNTDGYELAIYRDSNDVVHAHFMLDHRLTDLDDRSCPSYQIDTRQTRNTSVNSADCELESHSSQYVLGRIEANEVVSLPLYELMNGSNIDFRFRLESGGYQQTRFSLTGSKRVLVSVLGETLEVLPR